MINMTIKIGDRQEIVSIYKVKFEEVIKVPDGPLAWEHVYDLYIPEISNLLTDEDFIEICDSIGDMFITSATKNMKYANCVHMFKFVDKYVLPYAVNIYSVREMLTDMEPVCKLDTLIDIFDGVQLEYAPGMSSHNTTIQNFYDICKYGDYIPTGTLKDAYVIYRFLNAGLIRRLTTYKWFKSLKVLLVYLGLDKMIKLCKYDEEITLVPDDGNITKDVPSGTIRLLDGSPEYELMKDIGDVPEKDFPYYKSYDAGHVIMIVMSNSSLQHMNYPAFGILHYILKNHMNNVVLPETDALAISMNNFMNETYRK